MKRLIIILAALTVSLCAVANERAISFQQLPRKAQNFIAAHFGGLDISYITKENDITHITYEAYFANGSNIEFNGRGEWRQIETRGGTSVPVEILPKSVATFLDTNHPNTKVLTVDKERNEYELKLSGGTELSFDSHGRFRWYED